VKKFWEKENDRSAARRRLTAATNANPRFARDASPVKRKWPDFFNLKMLAIAWISGNAVGPDPSGKCGNRAIRYCILQQLSSVVFLTI
jgi:hypothetical protein